MGEPIQERADRSSVLRTHPGETGALLQDLLISVTNFFRDRDAFDAIAQHIPELFEHKTQNDSVRVWVPACATGASADGERSVDGRRIEVSERILGLRVHVRGTSRESN